MRIENGWKRVWLGVAAAGAAVWATASVQADVSPAEVIVEMAPGESITIDKQVTVPEHTPKLDFVLLVDLSGSYGDDLQNIRDRASDLFDTVRLDVADSRFGLATFVDFPFAPWGSVRSGDYAYQLDQDLTTDKAAWIAAVNAMSTSSGYDAPESQYEGLYQLVSGAGRQMPISTDDDYDDRGEIYPGLNATFRPDATKIVAITTDASFHEGGDSVSSEGGFLYPGATQAETIAALNAAGVKVIAIKAPGATEQMDAIALATDGAVVHTGDTSEEIADAIVAGIRSVVYTVSASPSSTCAPLELSYAPEAFFEVPSAGSVTFVETITVPTDITAADLDHDGKISCTVDFLADDTVVGTQLLEVTVPFNNPPVAQCRDLELYADGTCTADGDVNDGSYDPDGDAITLDYSVVGPYGVGITEVVLTVTDANGESDSCTGFVNVIDNTAPSVVVGAPIELWPPNHKYVDFGLADCVVSVTDSCAGEIDIASVGYISSIYSDEAEDALGNGDGKTLDDIVIVDHANFSLRAERAGDGNGRVYGITFGVDDGAGNVTEATCYVGVPHSQDGTAAVDDGPGAGYVVE